MRKVKVVPHARLTVEDIKWQWRSKLLTSAGYLYNYLLAAKRQGWKVRSTVTKLCDELEIGRATFYRALDSLKRDRLVNFEIHGEIELWVTNNTQKVSQICDSLSQVCDNSSQDRDTLSQDRDTLSQICNNQGSEVLQEVSHSNSPDLINSDQIYTDLSQFPALPPAEAEGEILKNSEEIQEEFLPSQINQNHQPNLQTINLVPEVITSSAAVSNAELLKFIEKQAPDNVRSPRAWAKACLANDLEYWQQKFDSDRLLRETNQQITGIPIDKQYGVQNPACYVLRERESTPIIKTIGNECAKLQAKWMLGQINPAFREQAIERAIELNFVVTDQGIHLPDWVTDSSIPLSEWEAF